MSSRILLIDVDGVACEHAQGICNEINKEHGTNYTKKHVVTWDCDFDGLITFCKAVEKYYPLGGFILSLKVTKGFKEFLETIRAEVEVVFATTRSHYAHESTKLWIKKNFGDYDVLFAKKRKTEFDFDYLIDDSEKEVIEAARSKRQSFLFSQPWNSNDFVSNEISGFKSIVRVKDFNEIASVICG